MQEKKEVAPDVKREDWNAEEVSEEATNQEPDEIVRQMTRGDETKGDADDRDIAGSPDRNETPHGREETKK